ncbi:MAG: hypothetical protein ACK526_03250 [Planctomyces sp.]|jgi:hypothetical protein
MASTEGSSAREDVTQNGTTSTRITSYLIEDGWPDRFVGLPQTRQSFRTTRREKRTSVAMA